MARTKSKTRVEKIREDREDLQPAGVTTAQIFGETSPGREEQGPAGTDADEALPNRTAGIATAGRLQIEMWATGELVPHPDNPRSSNLKTSKFLDLVESIRRNGILEALTVRLTRAGELQVLSGHRRLAAAIAAGLREVPIRNLGQIADDLAYDIVAMSNLHEDLTPLEEGRRAATWLDKYKQDAMAVASKLGKTEHWVLTHAMIERNLIAAWKEEGQRIPDREYDKRDYSHWTAAHWLQIARLPAAIQDHWLKKVQKDYRFDPHDASAEKVAGWFETEKLFLARAPFDYDKACAGCAKRTDAISQCLWQDPGLTVDEGLAVRCLDPQCWQRQCGKTIKQDFLVRKDRATVAHDIVGDKARAEVLPICLARPPEHWDRAKQKRYDDTMRPLRKAFGSGLVTVDRVTVLKAGAKGATLGIVVAGDAQHKKGSEVWVRVAAKETARGTPSKPRKLTAAELEAQDRQDKELERQHRVVEAFQDRFGTGEVPAADVILLALIFNGFQSPWGKNREKLLKAAGEATQKYPGQPIHCVMEYAWRAVDLTFTDDDDDVRRMMGLIGPSIGFDPKTEYDRQARKCSVCGCTDDDCRQCIEKTGKPCRWVKPDLCSACADEANRKATSDSKSPKGKRPAKAAAGPGDVAGPVGDCVGDCAACELEICAKTACFVDQGPKRNRKSKLRTVQTSTSPVENIGSYTLASKTLDPGSESSHD